MVHNDFLDWFSGGESKHPVFGKVVSKDDLAVIVAITEVPTNSDDVPKSPIKVTNVIVNM